MQTDDKDPIQVEAYRWLVLLRDDKASQQDRASFDTWLNADPRHRAAWDRANALWARFDAATDAMREGDNSDAPPPKGTTRRTLIIAAGAAALGATWWTTRPRADYVTSVGERRALALPDGTQAELGPLSELSLRFSPAFRRVLLHAGEAFFDTAPDPSRPFVVKTGDGTVQALGTRFNVRHIAGRTTVTVIDRRVLVRAGVSPAVQVEQGYQVSYAGNAIGPREPADLDAVQGWRNDRLVLHDVPLSAVLAELERYRPGRIFLIGQGLADVPVTAVFDAREPDAALDTIGATLNLRVRHLSRYLVIISSSA